MVHRGQSVIDVLLCLFIFIQKFNSLNDERRRRRHKHSIKRVKRCLEHESGRLFRKRNHGHGEIATRDYAITQGDEDGGFF
jgi:hypothetical protein